MDKSIKYSFPFGVILSNKVVNCECGQITSSYNHAHMHAKLSLNVVVTDEFSPSLSLKPKSFGAPFLLDAKF